MGWWFRMDGDAWNEGVRDFRGRLPRWMAVADLEYHASLARRPENPVPFPSKRDLATRWEWPPTTVLRLMKEVDPMDQKWTRNGPPNGPQKPSTDAHRSPASGPPFGPETDTRASLQRKEEEGGERPPLEDDPMTKMDPEMTVIRHPALQAEPVAESEPLDVIGVLHAENWWDEDLDGQLPYRTAVLAHQAADRLGAESFVATLRWLRSSDHPHAKKARNKDFHWMLSDLQESNRHRRTSLDADDGDTLAAVAELIRSSRVTP